MIIEHFARYYGWGDRSKYRLEIAVFTEGGSLWSKISGGRWRPLPITFLVGELGASIFWHNNNNNNNNTRFYTTIRSELQNLGRTFFRWHGSRVWQIDGQIDRHAMHSSSMVKIDEFYHAIVKFQILHTVSFNDLSVLTK